MLLVTNDTDTGRTFNMNHTNFTAWQFDLGIATFASHQLGAVASRTNQLGAFARLQFNGVDNTTNRNTLEWQTVASFNGNFFAAGQLGANFHALSGQDVVVGVVSVFNAGDASAAVGVVF